MTAKRPSPSLITRGFSVSGTSIKITNSFNRRVKVEPFKDDRIAKKFLMKSSIHTPMKKKKTMEKESKSYNMQPKRWDKKNYCIAKPKKEIFVLFHVQNEKFREKNIRNGVLMARRVVHRFFSKCDWRETTSGMSLSLSFQVFKRVHHYEQAVCSIRIDFWLDLCHELIDWMTWEGQRKLQVKECLSLFSILASSAFQIESSISKLTFHRLIWLLINDNDQQHQP